ncbi:ADP ribosylation factor interacting protein 1, transcript variant X2 [Ictidomys tridecemlineatus]|nr:ADP ribosylation factor interacting protein 1, transcript variant X2 [Ictidomys tridecemlineatus]
MWLLGPQPERRGQPLERGGGKFVRSALAPSRRGGAGPDLGRERPSRAKDHTTSGPLTSGFAALGAGSGGWVERSLVRVSSAVGQCEPVTAAVVPRPRGSEESTMAQESPKNSAAEIPVTSNGEVDDSHEHGFNRDLKRSLPSGLGLSETQITSHGFDSTKEGVIEAGAYQGGQRTQTKSGPVILADEIKNPAMEKLELVRKWSLNTYKCTRQIISEKLGRGSRTVDLELEAQIDILRDNKKKYENILRLAQTLSTQLFQMVHTQRQLGDAFADLSLKSLELHEEFGYNADTQKLLAKNGETLLGAINFFIASVNTLVNKTIEDTLMTVKQYESARIEYDAYRTDLEELNLGPRDANTLPKIEQSQHLFQAHKEKYDKMRNDVSIKLKFLEENKVKVLHNQLVLFHNAIAAYFAGNQKQLEQTLKQFHIKLKTPGVDAPSWLEEQ